VTSFPTTAEPRSPLRFDGCRTVIASSAISRIWSTTMPTLWFPQLKTSPAPDPADWWPGQVRLEDGSERNERKDAIAVLHNLSAATLSMADCGNSSSLATRESETATRSKEPDLKRRNLCLSDSAQRSAAHRTSLFTGLPKYPRILANAQHIED